MPRSEESVKEAKEGPTSTRAGAEATGQGACSKRAAEGPRAQGPRGAAGGVQEEASRVLPQLQLRGLCFYLFLLR